MKPGWHGDGGGLWLKVRKGEKGSRQWVFRFKWEGKNKEMGLGGVNNTDTIDARSLAANARKLVERGINPIEHRRLLAEEANKKPCPTFGEFADQYVEGLTRDYKTITNWKRTVEVYAVALRPLRLDEITTDNVVRVLQPTLKKVPVAGTKAIGHLRQVFAAAKVGGHRPGENPARWDDHLEHIIEKPKTLVSRGHHKALPYAELPALMARMKAMEGNGAKALRFTVLTAMRTTEVIESVWDEFDLERGVWAVPEDRMKKERFHRVALSADAIAILTSVPVSCEWVFPSSLRKGMPMDGMSMTRVLKRLGVKDRCTVHGFRSTFRDWVGDETEFPEELAEIALSHKVGTDVERAYRRGDALERRFALMEAWAEFCAGRSLECAEL